MNYFDIHNYISDKYCYLKGELVVAEFILDNIFNDLKEEHLNDEEKANKALKMVDEIHKKFYSLSKFFDPPIEEKFIEKLNQLN